jgi:flagellar biosynthesis/type III secretory pathway protein FliH
MERGPFVAAVQEALMRLPRPGENLYLRLHADEVEAWKKIVDDPGLPFNCTILVDGDVKPGHAYVEVSGARIDVGEQARIALVRAALGLDREMGDQQDIVLEHQSEDDARDLSDEVAHPDQGTLTDEVKPE